MERIAVLDTVGSRGVHSGLFSEALGGRDQGDHVLAVLGLRTREHGGRWLRTAGLGSSHACALTRGGDVRCWGDPPGAVLGTWPELEHCNVEEPNPNADALCEPATIQVFHCETERSCCVGDDESAASAIVVPL